MSDSTLSRFFKEVSSAEYSRESLATEAETISYASTSVCELCEILEQIPMLSATIDANIHLLRLFIFSFLIQYMAETIDEYKKVFDWVFKLALKSLNKSHKFPPGIIESAWPGRELLYTMALNEDADTLSSYFDSRCVELGVESSPFTAFKEIVLENVTYNRNDKNIMMIELTVANIVLDMDDVAGLISENIIALVVLHKLVGDVFANHFEILRHAQQTRYPSLPKF